MQINEQQALAFARRMIQSHPEVTKNPKSKAMVDAIMNGDSSKGTELAGNLCNTYGANPADAISKGLQQFGLLGGNK